MMDFLVHLATIITPIVLGFGFYFGWKQIVALKKARMAQIILMLNERWDSEYLEKSRQKLNETGSASNIKDAIIKAEKENSNDLYLLIRVGNFYDTVGGLVHEGYLDKNIAYELMGKGCEFYKNKYSQILTDPDRKVFFKCFIDLDEIFTKIKASRSKTKARSI